MTDQIPELPKALPKPITADLPPHLKDPKNYRKIQKLLLETLASTHSHADLAEWGACAACQRRMDERRMALQQLGFKNVGQYRAWVKTHETIKRRYPLVDWTKT